MSTVQQAAAEIVQLINSSPMSPRQEEIEAIIARAMPATLGGDDAIVRRWEASEAAHYAVALRNEEASDGQHESANDVLIRETRRMWREPVRGWPDIVVRAKAALYWRWPRFEQGQIEAYEALVREAEDLDDGPLALLIDAILTLEGRITGFQKNPVIRAAEHVGGHTPGKRLASASDVDFEPVVNPETGRPLEFEYTIHEFANTGHPSIVVAFGVIGKDREQLREVVRGLTNDPEDPGAEALFEMIDAFDSIHKKFEAIAHFAHVAMARVMMIADLEGRS